MSRRDEILSRFSADKEACRTLPFSDAPIQGESLIGLLARNVAKHGVDRVAPILKVAGIDTLVPDTISTMHIDKAEQIAALLRTSADEIASRCHPRVEVAGRPDSFINFFGTPIRSAYREANRRRVSPASLRVSPHHRALWDLRVLPFCPDSRELLISNCPSCDKRLGWRWTLGIEYCEHCGADLREQPQAIIEAADMEALDFVVDLVHPDPVRKARAAGAAPAALGADTGELFELAIAIACVIATEPDAPRAIMRRVKTLNDFAKLTPDILSRAGRVILNWPGAFHSLAEDMRNKAGERVGAYWGKKKELGPLVYLSRDGYLASAVRQEIRAQIDINMSKPNALLRRAEQRVDEDIVNVGRASAEFRIHPRVLARCAKKGLVWSKRNEEARNSIILVKRDEIAAVAALRKDLISARDLRDRLGVDPLALDDFAQCGLIRRHDGAVAEMSFGVNYSRADAQRFIDAVMSKAVAAPEDRAGVRLSKAVKRAAVVRPPWPEIFRAIIEGRLVVHVHPAKDNYALTTSLAVLDAADIAPFVADRPLAALTGAGAGVDRMNTHEAAAFLMCTEPALADFIKSGILPTNGSTMWKLDRATVDAFRRTHILANEIAHRCACRYRDVRTKLEALGVEPVHNADRNKNLVWRRDAVEAVIAQLFNESE